MWTISKTILKPFSSNDNLDQDETFTAATSFLGNRPFLDGFHSEWVEQGRR
jgi:hypothetical protein